MKSGIAKRSVAIVGHKTSISLEEAYWVALRDIAQMRNMPLGELIHQIDIARERPNLSSAIRLFVLDFYRGESARERSLRASERLARVGDGPSLAADLVAATAPTAATRRVPVA
jgi:predicted DNA-binding ribbon-helix-helix protein